LGGNDGVVGVCSGWRANGRGGRGRGRGEGVGGPDPKRARGLNPGGAGSSQPPGGKKGSEQPAKQPPALATALLRWLWAYFQGEHAPSRHLHTSRTGAAAAGGSGGDGFGAAHTNTNSSSSATTVVTLTGMPPLYLQHEGHSRTIIGLERRRVGRAAATAAATAAGARAQAGPPASTAAVAQSGASRGSSSHTAGEGVPSRSTAGMSWSGSTAGVNTGGLLGGGGIGPALDEGEWAYSLLILDPSTRTNELREALRCVCVCKELCRCVTGMRYRPGGIIGVQCRLCG
jgi:hypothetical protein